MLIIGVIGLALDLASAESKESGPCAGGSAMSLKDKDPAAASLRVARRHHGLHAYLNVNWAAVLNDYRPPMKRKIVVAYMPVTCQLTCPVTDYISKYSQNGEDFLPRMFQGFPEIKEALISNRVQAAFIVAPLASRSRRRAFPSRSSTSAIAMAAPLS